MNRTGLTNGVVRILNLFYTLVISKKYTLAVFKTLTLIFAFVSISIFSFGQTQTFTSSTTFTVPAGVTSVTVQAWGGGGAGGGNTTNNDGGGGGGGGAYSTATIAVIPNTIYTVNVGNGGNGSAGNGTAGGDSWFINNTTILAKGGLGGFSPSGGAGGVAGNGGAAAACIGTTRYSGGNGGTGRTSGTGIGGPGGSSAGTSANGTSGAFVWSTEVAGAPPADGGIGGDGGPRGSDGFTGMIPGAGGGGAGERWGANRSGGDGRFGQVVISWTQPIFYSQASGDPAVLANWNTNPGGGGYSPASFTDNYQTFVVQSGHVLTTTGVWTISGTNAILQISSGGVLTANNEISLAVGTSFQINNGGTYNHNTNTTTVWNGTETIGATSTISYGFAGNQNIETFNYGNLTINGGGTKTLLGAISLANGLTLNSGILQIGNFDLTILNNSAILGTFSATNMIETNGTGYVIREAATTLPIVFPVGTNSFYSPIEISSIDITIGTLSARTENDYTLGSNYLPRVWDLKSSLTGKTITSTFNYDALESALVPTTVWFKPILGAWQEPTSGSGSIGVNSFTITGTQNITNNSSYWTAGLIPNTFFSYQSGPWNVADTWTSDPGGTTLVNIGVPGDGDVVVILSDRTVTLPLDVNTTTLEVNINNGGVLDMATFAFTAGLSSLAGKGTLRLASANFPAAGTNTFVNAGGGTTEYYNTTDFSLPVAQLMYNHLRINTSVGVIATQMDTITINGDFHVKKGTFRINDNTAARRVLTINGNLTIDAGAFITTGLGQTSVLTPTTTPETGTAPFVDYYLSQSHTVIVKGNFINNGTVRFTNQNYPVYNAFPTNGFATVYFQGATNNTLTCNGTTDFYNLVIDKGVDQSFSLTVYSSAYSNFRLFGANNAGGYGGGANPNLNKALWIRTGTLILQGSTIIPSLSEGTCDAGTLGPNSDFFIPANAALVLDGLNVIVLSTADDYQEINVAYTVTAPDNATIGIGQGGCSSFSVLGKFQVNNGYFSTRESGGIITWSDASGQFVIKGGIVDAKQFRSEGTGGGLASYDQSGGEFYLRGRFQHVLDVSDINALKNLNVNITRANEGSLGAAFGTFNLNEAANVFTMSGGSISIYDACSSGGRVFDVLSSAGNINVTAGTLNLLPRTGTTDLTGDAAIQFIKSNAELGNLTISRLTGTSTVQLDTYPLRVLQNINITSGVLTANNLNVSVGGNFSIASGTTYTPGTNWTIFNGSGSQNLIAGTTGILALNKLKIDKPVGTVLTLVGSPTTTFSVNDSMMIVKGTLADGGRTINLAGTIATASYLYNSGAHSGSGKILLNDDVPQLITGDGNGIFQNLELNNSIGTAPISLGANTTINGVLTFSQDRLFNIGTYNLKLGATATIANAGPLRYFQTSGTAGDGGITKTYSASSTSFTFPIGAPTLTPARAVKYTPATLTLNGAPTAYGSITVVPVGYEHPATKVNNFSLTYFWRVKSLGFTLGAATVTHSYVYGAADMTGITTAECVAARYDAPSYSWSVGTIDDVDQASFIIGEPGTGTFLENKSFIDGDYTAGDIVGQNPFAIPTVFYSRANARWNLNTTWSTDPVLKHTGLAATGFPGINDVVVIGNNNTVNLTANASCASLQIENGSVLDIYTWSTTASDFGMVINHPNGNGLFRLTTTPGSPKLFTFPRGDFSDFNKNSGTTEFYDIDGTAGALYILPANVTQYGNLILRALNGDNIVLPNNNLTTIYGDLTFTGNLSTAWIAMSWNTNIAPYNNATLYNPTIEKTIHVTGNLNVNAGTFIFMPEAVPQHLIVEGNLIVASAGSIDIQTPVYGVPTGAPVANTIDIGGSLINNSTTAPYVRLRRGAYYCNTAFFGVNNAFVSGTGTSTIFNRVNINKGTSPSTTLTINVGGDLNTLSDNWLTLQNGTLRYMRSNPSSDFTISQGTAFTIPSTAGLYIDYPNNSGNRNILIADAASNTNDLFLNGKLSVLSGNVFIGPANGTTVNDNDIEYSGGGASAIVMQGGNLIVNGKIRRNPSTTNGILSYTQSGGNVIINGQNTTIANAGNAKLEVVNTSSVFNMSGGTITIVRGGGTTFGDLYLKAASSSVTGGEIIFTQGPTTVAGRPVANAVQNYTLEASVPLNNLTITGTGPSPSATVRLFSSPLVMNGNLVLTNANSTFDANSNLNINVTVKGGFTNNGAYNHYNNLTTFSGGVQSIQGSTATTFYNLLVNPVTSLSLIRDITVFNDLELRSGQLLNSTFNVNLKGNINIINTAGYDGSVSQGGVILNGTSLQLISGSGTFGRLELNNSAGARLENDITLQKNFILTKGVLDINDELFTLGENSIIEGSSFNNTKMIASDGVYSNVGLRKFFTVYSGPKKDFIYPIGTSGKYTPAKLSYTDIGATGSVRINNINSNHPGVYTPANVLHYFWDVASNSITGFKGSLVLNYKQTDVFVVVPSTEADYIAAALVNPPLGTTWIKSGPGGDDLTDKVYQDGDSIKFDFPLSDNLSGEYTCGIDIALPDNVPQYKSIADGDWNDPTKWLQTGGDNYALTTGPNGFIVTISPDDTISIDANFAFTYRMIIEGTLRVVYPYIGNNFGLVSGNGTLYLESATFPAGRYNDFLDCSNNATLEYGGSLDYALIADLYSTIPKLYFTGTGIRTLPNKDLTICNRLLINGPTLNNSVNNKKLTIQGTMERLSGTFTSGSGAGAIVSFEGSAVQTIGGALGDFTGANSFNHFEINNSAGLTVNTSGEIEIAGNLMLTSGIITTTATDKLTITNATVASVLPAGGSALSFVDGPLIKKINAGDSFNYPIGKGTTLGNKLTLSGVKTGSMLWTAEFFTPNSTAGDYSAPLTYVNTQEYWKVYTESADSAFISLKWNPASDLTPLMTQNGVSDMRLTKYNTLVPIWQMISTSISSGDNNNGSVSTSKRLAIPVSDTSDFTLACINTTKPRARLNPTGPVCGGAGIPVSITVSFPINFDYIIGYDKNGSAQTPVTFTAADTPPYLIPTDATGADYQLTSFTYNNPTPISGVVDPSIITTYNVPSTALAGPDQSQFLCGATSATLAANNPGVGSGLWTIISGTGGTVVSPTSNTSTFNGTNGSTYNLVWTISTGGGCTSSDTVRIAFPLNPAVPVFSISSASVCEGQQDVIYRVVNDPTVTYTWSYTPPAGVSVSAVVNTATVDFNPTAASGTMGVTATNGCGTSAPATVAVTVNPLPTLRNVTGGGSYCIGGAGVLIGVDQSFVGTNYILYRDGVATGDVAAGLGAALNFPLQTVAGTYTVLAQNATTLCTQLMNGSRIIIVNPLPMALDQTPADLCSEVAGENAQVTVDLTTLEASINTDASGDLFEWFKDALLTIPVVDDTNETINVTINGGPFSTIALYYCKVTNTVSSCTDTAVVTFTIYRIPETGEPFHLPN